MEWDSRPTLRDLFEAALALPRGERDAFVASRCADPADRARLLRLLAADDAAEEAAGALPRRAAPDLASAIGESAEDTAWQAGQTVGPYRLGELLGSGGSAEVFRAWREFDGARQVVALKLLRRSLVSPEARRLFRRERQALAALSHPDIAHLVDGGVSEGGQAYLAMEFVDGVPITRFAQERSLALASRLRLMIRVCRAVAIAHRNLIVHRDLKPANILVTAEGQVKLLDFGIAKLLDDELLDGEQSTRTGWAALTPGYAAPEQYAGGPVTTATDVHALGVVLHELLSGERPAVRSGASAASEAAAPGPGDTTRPRAVARAAMRGDVGTVIRKAMADEPGRRYASAAELADDLERYLRAEPVRAHPPSAWYRTRKFVQRHRGGVALSAAFAIGVLASLGVALWQAQQARQQAQLAQREAARASAVRDFLESMFRPVRQGIAEGRQPTVVELVARGAEALDEQTGLAPPQRVDLLMMFARLHANIGETARARELAIAADTLAGESLDPLHPAAVGALALRGIRLVRDGETEAGAVLLEEAATRARRIDDPVLIAVLDTQAVAATDLGDAGTALRHAREALALRLRHYGPDDERMAAGYNNLAYGLVGVGRFEEAVEAYRQTWEIDRRFRPEHSYDVLSALSNWGWALHQAGRVREARALLAQAEAGFATLGGRARMGHVLNSQKLCGIDIAWGLPADAEASCRRMLAVTREMTGGEGLFMAYALRMEAQRLLELGRLDEATAMLDGAAAQLSDGPGHARGRAGVALVRAQLAWLAGEAGPARRRASAALEEGAVHRQADTQDLPARSLLLLACIDAPLEPPCQGLASELADALAHLPWPGDPRALPARTALARRALGHGDPDQAAALARTALEQTAGELDPAQAQVLAARAWLAAALAEGGDCVTARTVRADIAAAARQAGNAGSPWLQEADRHWRQRGMCP